MTRLLVLIALVAGLSLPACAQEWPIPGRPIRILNPFPPGGTADTLSRMFAARLTAQLGVSVVVENRPGGSTMVAVSELQILFDAPLTAINNARAGKVKMLAVAGPARISMIDNMPTMADAGLKGFGIPGLEQLLGPPGMPKPLVAKVNAALVQALRSPEISKVYQASGFIFLATSSEEYAAS